MPEPTNPEDQNILRPRFSETTRGIPQFDPKKEIAEDDWGKISGYLRGLTFNDFSESINILWAARVIAPSKLFEAISAKTIDDFIKDYDLQFGAGIWDMYARLHAIEKQIFPERPVVQKIRANPALLGIQSELKEELIASQEDDIELEPYMLLMRDVALIDPEETNTSAAQEQYAKLKSYVTSVIEETREQETSVTWNSVLTFANAIRIIYPDKLLRLPITSGDWRSIQQELHSAKSHEEWQNFLPLAMNMYMYTADELQPSEHGLQVIHYTDESRPRAEVMQFVPKK